MARFFRRRAVRVVLGVLVLLIALAAAAPLLVPAEKLRELAIARVRGATGADVTFGQASVRLLPRLSVAVADGRVRGTGEALARATGQASPLASYDVSLERLELSVALRPLLKRRVEIGRVRLVRPVVELVTRAPVAADTTAGAAQASPASKPGLAIALAALEVREGTLHWSEEGTGRTVAVEGWQQDLTAGDLTRLAAALQAFASGTPLSGEGRGAARLGLDLRVASLTLRGFGQASPLAWQDLEFSGELEVPATVDRLRFAVNRLAWGGQALSGEGELVASADGGRHLTANWRLADSELASLMKSLTTMKPLPAGPAAQWLAGEPVTQGKLALAGGLKLPWPLPHGAGASSGALLAGLEVEGSVQEASVTLPGGLGVAQLDAAFTLHEGVLAVTKLIARDPQRGLDLRGNATLPVSAAVGRLRAQLEGEVDLAQLAALAALLPKPDAPVAGQVRPGLDAYRFTGRARLSARADLAGAPAVTNVAGWKTLLKAAAPAGVAVEANVADFSVAGQWLQPPLAVRKVTVRSDLREARIGLEGAAHPMLRGEGEVHVTRFKPAPHAECDLRLAFFDADRLTEMVTARGPTALLSPSGEAGRPLLELIVATAQAAPAAAGAAPGELLPADLTASYRASADTLVAGKIRYEKAELAGTLAGRVFDAPQVSARLSTGTVAGKAKVDYAADPWGKLTFDAAFKDVPAAALLAPYVPGAARLWEGKIGGDLSGGCGLKDKQAVLASLALEGLAVSTNGVIHGSGLLAGVSQYLGARQDLKEIRFKDLSHHLSVRDGRYVISDLTLEGLDTDWTGDGWIGFDGGIDLRLTVKLPAGFRPELGSLAPLADALRGPDGRIVLTMKLSGKASSPEVGLDLTAPRTGAQEQLKDKAKLGVDRLLDRLKRR